MIAAGKLPDSLLKWLAGAAPAFFLAIVPLAPAKAQQWQIEVRPVGPLHICAAIDNAGKASLTARSARGCLSSSCRGFVRSTLKSEVRDGQIRLIGDLMHRKPAGRAICTRDCGGARTVAVAVEGLAPGRYMIIHNGKEYGTIVLTRGGKPICVTGK